MSTCTECFQALGCFDYNAANKISNKIIKINNIGTILATITRCEQSYTSFEYLKTSKFFRRDDYLNTEFINSINNLIKSTPPIPHNEDHIDPGYLMKLCKDLKNFIRIRQEQISIYRTISTHFSNLNSDHIIDQIEACKEKAENLKLIGNLGPLGIGVERELTILGYLFKAQKEIIAYDFKNSTIFLYNAKSNLSSWKEICSQQVYPEEKPEQHQPNIISIIQDNKNNKRLSPFTTSTPGQFYDNKIGRYYYYIRIDDHVWLIIILPPEKHSIPNNAIESIMSLSKRLSGFEILNNLQKFGE
ncbi:4064_t:CDS:2 [Diversispora eburnea]|uniref:4064_t:CDS:1 n=1 Tax=Diversispora eburnea TaxID=1213867 RepID=A0A9N9CA68_9GLOM|nr:4064_t:CDS:2 [Diversispora eburnea]